MPTLACSVASPAPVKYGKMEVSKEGRKKERKEGRKDGRTDGRKEREGRKVKKGR